MYVCTPEEGIDSITDSSALPCECWDSGPPQEQPVLLGAESSLQLLFVCLFV